MVHSGVVVGSFAICTAYALMSSGHLPLMMPMLLLACLAEGSDILFPYRSPSPRARPDPTHGTETEPKRSQTEPKRRTETDRIDLSGGTARWGAANGGLRDGGLSKSEDI